MRQFNLSTAPDSIRSDKPSMVALFNVDSDAPELRIMDDIGAGFGQGVTAVEVRDFLAEHPGPIKVHINSFGGDVYEGLSIYNALLEHGEATGIVDGIAFSAASIVAMGCKHLAMRKASDFGIHRAWTLTAGNSRQLRADIEWLELVDRHQVEIFSEKTGEPPETIYGWLDGTSDGTVWAAADAYANGFADSVLDLEAEDMDVAAYGRMRQTAAARIYQQRQRSLARRLRRK